MRVTGGSLKGRELAAPKGRAVRPTSGKVRESIFSVIGPRIAGSRVLDLFCGVGTLGIEAMSRGAREAVFLETSPAALKFLERNLSTLGIRDVAKVIKSDCRSFLRSKAPCREFDLVFADPPYSLKCGREIVELLEEQDILCPGALVVFEHSRFEDLPDRTGKLLLAKRRRFGDSVFSIYEASAKEGK
ncbi:MAG: 16S rRNA (guanine(966)-N(2))-methyltransferase RsmD [Candidatus Eisenbacteria bacterium]|nr:16S rRNA (guanine(966)-N(2))-methyltransferase RsmD [Candidatus Eisenbacteria bacterium]